MPTGSVIVIDCCLFFGCKTSFAQNDTLDLWNAIALPLIQMIVFLCRSWYFSTFNYNSCPFLCSSFFLKVWISLSITYRQTFELTCASSFPDLHILRYWWPPSHPLGVNVITECPICYFSAVSQKKWTKLIFCMQINIKRFYQLILTIFPSKFCTRWYYQYWWTW